MHFLGYKKVYIGQKRQKCQEPGKVKHCLNRLKRGKHVDEGICKRIRRFAAVTPTLYGLPKKTQ